MNGSAPEYFVGRVREMGNHAHRELLLPAGFQRVIILDLSCDKEIYSGTIEIISGKTAILNTNTRSVKYESWVQGARNIPLLRYDKTRIAVAPVAATLGVYPGFVNCNQPVHLVWKSAEAAQGAIRIRTVSSNSQSVVLSTDTNGELLLSPTRTTTYSFEAIGPGGKQVADATIQVDNTVKTTLTALPKFIRHHQIGDKVLAPGTATLQWSATNADSVILDPFGPVTGESGEKIISFTPSTADFGPLYETRTYKIVATNTCGGASTTTALVQIIGSIDPEIVAYAVPPVINKIDGEQTLECSANPKRVVSGNTVRIHCDSSESTSRIVHKSNYGNFSGRGSDFLIDTLNWPPGMYSVESRTRFDYEYETEITHFEVLPNPAKCQGLFLFVYPSLIDLGKIERPDSAFKAIAGRYPRDLADFINEAVNKGACQSSRSCEELLKDGCATTTFSLKGRDSYVQIWPLRRMTPYMTATIIGLDELSPLPDRVTRGMLVEVQDSGPGVLKPRMTMASL